MLGACYNARNSSAGCMFEFHVIDTLENGFFLQRLVVHDSVDEDAIT